jgi:hypothetical protein
MRDLILFLSAIAKNHHVEFLFLLIELTHRKPSMFSDFRMAKTENDILFGNSCFY